jgi:hypothetical protein
MPLFRSEKEKWGTREARQSHLAGCAGPLREKLRLPLNELDLCSVELALLRSQHSDGGTFRPLNGWEELVEKGFGVEGREW